MSATAGGSTFAALGVDVGQSQQSHPPSSSSSSSARSEATANQHLRSFLQTPAPGDFRGRLDYIDGHRRLQATTFLFVGASSGIMGFCFAGYLGIYKYKHCDVHTCQSFRGEPFASGRNFHPATVSEMVHDPSTPEGKVFFAFCMLSAICVLVSGYPWALRNVFMGHNHLSYNIKPFCGSFGERPIWVNLVSLRQFLPPIGLLLVVCIPVTVGPRRFTEAIAAGVHTAGAVLMFATYIAFEFHALWWSPVLKVSGTERWLRKWLAILALVSSIAFQLFAVYQTICLAACRNGLCSCTEKSSYFDLCVDQWQVPTQEDIQFSKSRGYWSAWVRQVSAADANQELLLNTATGWYGTLKVAIYWLEVVAGVSLLSSHLVIWYFCLERNVEIGESLPDIQNQYRNMDQAAAEAS